MAGSTNFLQFNPNATNQESDATYTSDSMRSGGAAVNAILPSPLFNKLNYQVSIMVAALATMLKNKGYSPNDGSAAPASALTNLAGVLANIMTAADMTPYALLNSPAFTGTPTAPTPAPGDNSTKIATTAFLAALLGSGFQISLGTNGYIRFPAALGGFIIQWAVGAGLPANNPGGVTACQETVSWPLAFPNACLFAACGTNIATNYGASWDIIWQTIGAPTKTGVQVVMMQVGNSLPSFLTYPVCIGFGY